MGEAAERDRSDHVIQTRGEVPSPESRHTGTRRVSALAPLALVSVWHLALWHSTPCGTWHSGTRLRVALGTLAPHPCGTWPCGIQFARFARQVDLASHLCRCYRAADLESARLSGRRVPGSARVPL